MKELDNLRDAFPAMPEECRSALSTAARSVREEPMRRKYPVAILVAAILTLMTTIAIAEGWNVLAFLGIQPDSDAQTLVQPVSVAASAGNVTLSIDSAITDGEYLAFDWTVENNTPDIPVFLQVDSYTVNGQKLHPGSNDSFHCRWLPNWASNGMMQGGELTELPDNLTGNALQVELRIAVHTPEKPVYPISVASIINEIDAELVRAKWAEGYYVLESSGEGFIIDDPEEGPVWVFSDVNKKTSSGLVRSEMLLCFTLDLKAARKSIRTLDCPPSVTADGVTLALTGITVTPLQTRLSAAVTCESGSKDVLLHWAHRDEFVLTDGAGHELDLYSLCTQPFGEVSVQENPDGTWRRQWDFTLLDVGAAMPDGLVLSYRLDEQARLEDGTPLEEPLILNLPFAIQ